MLKFLNEAEQLDVSIPSAGKYLNTDKKIEEFLNSEVLIEHKTDGVKLTVIKKENNGDLNDYIISYKGNILYSTEFDYASNVKIKKESIGASQFKNVFTHFNKLPKNSIPVGTELFIEFLINKPTLSSDYNTKHKMVLIGYAKSKWTEKFGKLKTNPGKMLKAKRDVYANALKIDVPQILFDGVLGSELTLSKGIKNAKLKAEYSNRKFSMNWDNPTLLLDDIREMLLAVESKYGGKEEGVVLIYNNILLKFQQEYQLDQNARFEIKQKYREDIQEDENNYWSNVKREALQIAASMVVKSRKLEDLLSEIASVIKKIELDFSHSKKTETNIKDDIQLNAKTLIVKKMRGNNGALIIGKFRVLTKEGHTKLIKRASTLYDNVVIAIVTSKDNKETKQIREEMIKKVFPNAEIVHVVNGNVVSIINKSPININVIYAGSDRIGAYQRQTKNMLGVDVREMPRTDDDISASKVIENIDDEAFFKKNTPKQIHSLYTKLRGFYDKV